MPTLVHVNPITLHAVQDLVRQSTASAAFYAEAACARESGVLRRTCDELARARANQARVLTAQLRIHDMDPPAARMSRPSDAWDELRASFPALDDLSLAAKALRAEERLLRSYEALLPQTAGTELGSALHAQYSRVRAARTRLREARDALAAVQWRQATKGTPLSHARHA